MACTPTPTTNKAEEPAASVMVTSTPVARATATPSKPTLNATKLDPTKEARIRANQLLAEARVAGNEEMYQLAQEAGELYKKNMGSNAQLASAKYLAGLSLYQRERYEDAVPFLKRAVDLAPKEAEYRQALKQCRGQISLKEGDAAIERAAEAVAAEDFKSGIKEAENARKHYDNAPRDNERYAVANFVLGVAHIRLGNIEVGKEFLRGAIKLDPSELRYPEVLAQVEAAERQAWLAAQQQQLQSQQLELLQRHQALLQQRESYVGGYGGCSEAASYASDAASYAGRGRRADSLSEVRDYANKAYQAASMAESAANSCDCDEASSVASAASDAATYARRALNEDDLDEATRYLKKAESEAEDAESKASWCEADD